MTKGLEKVSKSSFAEDRFWRLDIQQNDSHPDDTLQKEVSKFMYCSAERHSF
jgi:hypothetical protein